MSATSAAGSYGSPTMPSAHEMETTAYTAVARGSLGIQKDTLTKPFSQIDRETTWNFSSTASNPSLAPLVHVRVSTAQSKTQDEKWNSQFNRLMDLLPEDVRTEYLKQAGLPPEQRSAAFASLDRVLGMTATVLATVDTAAAKTVVNEGLLGDLRGNFLAEGQALLSSADSYLQNIGHASPQFDRLMSTTTDLGVMFSQFQSLMKEGAGASKDDWAKLAGNLDTLGRQLSSYGGQGDLQALGANIEALALIASASSLKSASPSLLIALSMASVDIHDANGQGSLSPLMGKAVTGVSDFLLATLMPNAEPGSKKLLPLLVGSLLLGGVSLAHLSKGQASVDLLLGLNLMESSGALAKIGTETANASGIAENKQAQGADIFLTAALFTLINSLAMDDPKAAGRLSGSLSEPLERMLSTVQQYSSNQLSDQNYQSQLSNEIDSLMEQLRIALNQDDQMHFLETLDNTAGAIAEGAMKDRVQNRLEQVRNFVDILREMVKEGHAEGSTTGIFMA